MRSTRKKRLTVAGHLRLIVRRAVPKPEEPILLAFHVERLVLEVLPSRVL